MRGTMLTLGLSGTPVREALLPDSRLRGNDGFVRGTWRGGLLRDPMGSACLSVSAHAVRNNRRHPRAGGDPC